MLPIAFFEFLYPVPWTVPNLFLVFFWCLADHLLIYRFEKTTTPCCRSKTLIFVPVVVFVPNLRPATARRGMAGGPIPARYKVTKNKFVEEWNGRREITEKIWECDQKMAAQLFLYVVVVPYGFYSLTRGEFQSKGDRRYKDCV